MRVAKTLIYDPEGNILLLRRSETHPSYALESDIPGGIIERGETYEGGLARELEEEIGVTVAPDQFTLIGERKGMGFTKKRLYELHLTERPTITISWEHASYEWVPGTEYESRLESRDDYIEFVKSTLKNKKPL